MADIDHDLARHIAEKHAVGDTGWGLLARAYLESRAEIRKLRRVRDAARQLEETFLPRLLHGDEAHRQWLKDEVDFCFAPLNRALRSCEVTNEIVE